MANEQITFDKLPQAVGYLTEQMEQIRQMVAALQPQASSDKHRLVEIDEACKITRKAKPTIYTLARKGLIPAYKKGKKLYFYEDELLKWIESGRKQMRAMSLQEQAAEIVHGAIIRKSKFPQNPKRSVRFSGKGTKRSVQKRKARNTQKAETKVL